MQKIVRLLLLAGVVAGAWWFWRHFELAGLNHISIRPREAQSDDSNSVESGSLASPAATIRVASYHVQNFDASKAAKPQVLRTVASIIRQFDAVALQGVDSSTGNDVIAQLLAVINSGGRHFDCVLGPPASQLAGNQRLAFLYDQDTLYVDREAAYPVSDPDHLFHHPPLVAWFRARRPAVADAFTFSLINVQIEPEDTASEVNQLVGVMRAVRNDGRGEDDVIVLGDLGADDQHLGRLGQLSNMSCAISSGSTVTRGGKLLDNLVFNRTATCEYTGRSGVLDVVRQFNLTTDEALQISDHLPVWAEFSAFEGGPGRRMASRAAAGR